MREDLTLFLNDPEGPMDKVRWDQVAIEKMIRLGNDGFSYEKIADVLKKLPKQAAIGVSPRLAYF